METIGVRFPSVHAALLRESAKSRRMTVSDVLREAFEFWREHSGDRQFALEKWTRDLIGEHGEAGALVVMYDEDREGDVAVYANREDAANDITDRLFAEVVYDVGDRVQLWIGDPASDARAMVGKVPPHSQAAVIVPLSMIPRLGASDVDTV